jgi:membrane protein DedA with SNARE-associated domain
MGSANVGVLIALASTAAVLGDHVWYVAGRLGGDRLLRFYCRVAMFGATSCVDKARAYFVRFGPAVFIIGRFVAGVRILITPLAASSGMPYLRYLIYDSSGAAVWATVWILVGYLIGDQWAAWTEKPGVAALGAIFSLGATLTVGLTLAFRWWQRQRQTPTAL